MTNVQYSQIEHICKTFSFLVAITSETSYRPIVLYTLNGRIVSKLDC